MSRKKTKQMAGKLNDLGGSKSDQWNQRLIIQTMDSLWLAGADEEGQANLKRAALAALKGIAPKDEMEGMMAAQMIASHNAAMECHRRAMIAEQDREGRRENLSQANKLSRTYATLLETLNRHRGKGQQKVTVEHVHVHPGGQAIVGNVATSPRVGGGGGEGIIEDQHHAKQIADARQSPLPCTDEAGDAVPVSRNAERALPDARRKIARRPERE